MASLQQIQESHEQELKQRAINKRKMLREKVQNPRERAAAIKIQTMFRGHLSRKLFKKCVADALAATRPKELDLSEEEMREQELDEATRVARSLLPRNEQLIIAVQNNEYLEVVRLFEEADVPTDIKEGDDAAHKLFLDVNYREPLTGQSPLMIAARKGHYNLLKVCFRSSVPNYLLVRFSHGSTCFL